jgi:hypothetical protein
MGYGKGVHPAIIEQDPLMRRSCGRLQELPASAIPSNTNLATRLCTEAANEGHELTEEIGPEASH